MTILSKPVVSTSHKGWETIAASSKNLVVQRRSAQGLETNERLSHRIFYKSTDLYAFRVIYSEDPADFVATAAASGTAPTPSGGVPSSRATSADRRRAVVAVGETEGEILKDWDWIQQAMAHSPPDNIAKEWEDFYQRVVAAREQDAAAEGRNGVTDAHFRSVPHDSFSPIVLRDSADEGSASPTGGETTSAAAGAAFDDDNTSFIRDAQDATAIANSSSGCTDTEVWAARIVGAWGWSDAYQSSLLSVLFVMPWMNWLVATVVVCLAGVNFPRRSRAAMTGDEVRRTVDAMNARLQHIGQRNVKSFLASIILLNYISTVWLPPQFRLISLFESYGRYAVSASLVLGLIIRLVSPAKAKTQPAAAPVAAAGKRSAADAPPSSSGAAPPPTPVRPDGDLTSIPEVLTVNALFNNSAGWTYVSTKNNVRFEKKKSPYCNKDACRFTVNVPNATAGSLMQVFSDDPDLTRKDALAYKFDRLLEKRHIVERLDGGLLTAHNYFKSPVWAISARDFISTVTAKWLSPAQQRLLNVRPASASSDDKDDLAVWMQGAVDAQDREPAVTGYVRGAIHRYMMLGKEEKDGSLTIVMMFSVDPQGSIPASAVAMSNAEQGSKLGRIAALVAQFGPVPRPAAAVQAASPPPPAAAAALAAPEDDVEVDSIIESWATDLYHANDWTRQPQSTAEVEYSQKPVPWCDKVAVRVVMFIKGVKAHALDRVINEVSLVPKFDRLIKDKVKVRDISDTRALFYSRYNSPIWGIAARDFAAITVPSTYLTPAQQRKLRLVPPAKPGTNGQPGGGGAVFVHAAKDGGSEMPKAEKFERGAVHLYAFVAQEVGAANGYPEDGVLLTAITSADPCGKIPASIVNSTNAEQMEKLKIIAKLMITVSKS